MNSMTQAEKELINILEANNNKEIRARLLGMFIQSYGPLTYEAGIRVRELLGEADK